jgi:hypothetical protein
MRVSSAVTTLRSFSPIGEAIFKERGDPPAQVVADRETPLLRDLQADRALSAPEVATLEIN